MSGILFHICVVDDDCAQTEALSEFLAGKGYEVRTFSSASEFLSRRHELERLDLIISDINMPGHSGYDLCRAVRSGPSLGRVPIILVTGGEGMEEKARGLEAGADEFIAKPYSMQELKAKVRSLLDIRAKELDTLQELTRLERLRGFLSPNVASLLTRENQQTWLAPHRAEVSVLFVDLRRFTAFSEKGEPEEVLEVLGNYYTAVGNAAIKYNGTLGHLAGDGIMVFFNDPQPVLNHKETAVRMAIEAREALILQRDIWRERHYDIDFGMGLSAGFATIGAIGFERFSHYSVIGPVTNFASRLCQVAAGGQILVSHRFLSRLEDGACQAESVGQVNLKGIEDAVSVYNVLSMTEEKSRVA